MATLLREAGHHTAMIGKSGVACLAGDASLPNGKGFDQFYGPFPLVSVCPAGLVAWLNGVVDKKQAEYR